MLAKVLKFENFTFKQSVRMLKRARALTKYIFLWPECRFLFVRIRVRV